MTSLNGHRFDTVCISCGQVFNRLKGPKDGILQGIYCLDCRPRVGAFSRFPDPEEDGLTILSPRFKFRK